ncbi:glycosyltransferase family 2 protein [Klebsiella variicola]|uniref:glycosyltransferase family 2 protein n=1 Tax=Klebsiella variicola TaxID=244366 RepID=UPI0012392D82|nr:glycosyltransferase family 2 protein [Klebsiella variicola]ELA2370365.1 glycosyltransferase family 2 protein [Klebsiella variicola]ELA2407313.1 glycosyltransferase family 2 protein [Klebsiella variicola]QET25153.1 glycosyltransferase family 2 protein [Klebsiella variicola]
MKPKNFIQKCKSYYIYKIQDPLLSMIYTRLFERNNKIKSGRYQNLENVLPNVDVSLTTHGDRITSVHITIESILSGKVLPARIILWLDNENAIKNLPLSLVRLKDRGLEIKLSKNYGPHTKYFPYILERKHNDYLVTADDDIIYPKNWLFDLYSAAKTCSDVIVCHRAHEITFDGRGKFKPYEEWNACSSIEKNIAFFATGVSGVIYPKNFLDHLYKAGDDFINKCPRADDVWLHYMAYLNNYKVMQLKKTSAHFLIVNNTQHLGLMNTNVLMSQNDSQILKTYSFKDMENIFLLSKVCNQ